VASTLLEAAMNETPAQRALTASTAALVAAAACVAMFLPPLLSQTLGSVLRTVIVALALATGLVLHWVFLAIAARLLGRSVGGWLSLSVLLFPVGSAAALILLGWFREEAEPAAHAA
jgi:hypothetical protein